MRRKDRIFEEIIQELEYATNISLVTMFLPAVCGYFRTYKTTFSKKLRQKKKTSRLHIYLVACMLNIYATKT